LDEILYTHQAYRKKQNRERGRDTESNVGRERDTYLHPLCDVLANGFLLQFYQNIEVAYQTTEKQEKKETASNIKRRVYYGRRKGICKHAA